MKEYAQQSRSKSRTLESNPKASRQAPIDVILQQYKEGSTQYSHLQESISCTQNDYPKVSSQSSLTEPLLRRSPNYPQHQATHPTSSVVQAMSVQKEPTDKRLFAVSDDKKMVTGMNTPNHELYVESLDQIEEMNQFAKRSKLFFRPAAKMYKLFGKNYRRIEVGFKDKEKVSVKGKREVPTTKKITLNSIYHKKVAPAIFSYRANKKQAVQKEISTCLSKPHYIALKRSVSEMTSAVELFKKLVIYEQTTEDYHDIINPMDFYLNFVTLAEDLLFTEKATTDTMKAKLVKLANAEILLRSVTHLSSFLQEQLVKVMHYGNEVVMNIPRDKTIDLFLLHRDNTEDAMIDSIEQGEPMFYRSCDVMAATIMGNTIDDRNKEQLKVYSSNDSSGAFHYAAKVLQSGNDWVTLESFAAGEREAKVFGITEGELDKNLDNSWNYLMYGSIKKKHDDFQSPDDNFFELYTKLRYYLKGITHAGTMNMAQRNKTNGVVPVDAFTDLASGFTLERSKDIWERLCFNQILDRTGRVLKESFLDPAYIGLRLSDSDRPYTKLIRDRILQYHRESSGITFIQPSPSNEMRNIIGWMSFLELGVDTEELLFSFLDELATEQDQSQELHDLGWDQLMKKLI